MCLVIDANCFARVFDSDNKEHAQFVAVWNWINAGKGCMIYGGSKYGTELRAAPKFLPIITELERKGKTVHLSDANVDTVAAALKKKIPDPKFDDEHIVAIVILSRCRVVCTKDNTAISFLRRKDVYADYAGVSRPSIYRGRKSHFKLCCDKHIVAVCRK
jgi:hypothetical protein